MLLLSSCLAAPVLSDNLLYEDIFLFLALSGTVRLSKMWGLKNSAVNRVKVIFVWELHESLLQTAESKTKLRIKSVYKFKISKGTGRMVQTDFTNIAVWHSEFVF